MQEDIKEVAQCITKKLPNGGLICITGAGASGKTTCANMLASLLGDVVVYPFDGLHTPISYRRKKLRQSHVITGAHPDTVPKELALKTIKSLKQGIETPIYRGKEENGSVTFEIVGLCKRRKYIIVDGLTALHHGLQKYYDFVIFVDCSREAEWKRRLKRDMEERDQTEEEIKNIFNLRREQYEKYVLPYKKYADVVIDCTSSS